jgi:acetyl-CoA carboxylase carboxyltransferase component
VQRESGGMQKSEEVKRGAGVSSMFKNEIAVPKIIPQIRKYII